MGRTQGWKLAVGCALLAGATLAVAQDAPVVTGDKRVDKLLSQMTLEEKITLIHGTQEDPKVYQGQAGYLAGVPRLGIPGLRLADGPPGVLTRHPSQAETATMGVAATFSEKDAEANGLVIGREDRALGIDVSLQPFVNIDRDLEFGRGYNTFGEDPYLTSVMGAAEIKGIQSQHVMAQVKHYVGYDSDGTSTYIDDQTLHEVYVAPFDAAVKADVSSIMCSYNRLNGTFACGNKDSLTTILRDQIGFKGFVTSDWGATHAVNFINAGLDMEMPGEPAENAPFSLPSFFDLKPVPAAPDMSKLSAMIEDNDNMFGNHIPEEPAKQPGDLGDFGTKLDPKKLKEALADGTVTEAAITRAAGRVLYEIVHFGYMDGQSKHDVTTQAIEANAKIIEKTGEDSAVLLKNDGAALPLKDLDSVVLIGPTAAQVDAIGINGERSVGLPERQIGPLAAMKKISGKNIQFAVADDMTGTTIPAAMLTHDGKPGLLRTTGDKQQTDAQLDFTKKNGKALAANSIVKWTGEINVPAAGNYWIYLQALGANAVINLDGKKLSATGAFQGGVHGDILQANQDNVIPTPDGLDNVRRAVDLTAGAHKVEITTSDDTSKAPVQMRLNWYTPQQRQADHDAAIAAAKKAKTAVVFVWTRLEPVFGLPGDQDKLVEEIAAVNPNTVVVLNTSQPVALPWVDKVKAVLEMWWPGDEGGWATANILLGKTSPAGRLPVTWAKKLTDYAATNPRFPERSKKGVGHKTTYSEGVHLGYRWFDKENVEPLFAFGHGLSYTTFEYSGLKIAKAADGGLDVSLTIKNTGGVDSDEVPQVYLGAPGSGPQDAQFPVRKLVAFDRVQIGAGKSQTVSLHVPERQLQYWSTKDQKWVTLTASRTLSVGGSSRALPLKQPVE
ncbi:glycoside hydrolase, family 3-like protein [Candidatus Koribacter versatilis Ellin345]|uniref:Glycoside hydrolase, family 3-like protein n=1 Tax=Koribacter versatilis (strain Ellin345) TaxID=204669 RepID=Q1IPT9_KORVE|nr:glycoside hydrolase family 3 C-terminal domain-containing protein [Candidatus Koribacter versatilis]ABF41111.1 glycoside hydrolase, family 3-like protein [Candidatus Koribacter versatilis Ellin345]